MKNNISANLHQKSLSPSRKFLLDMLHNMSLSILSYHRRVIKWSLRAFLSMRAVRLFLRARAVIKYVLLALSSLKNTDGEQQALLKFSSRNLDLFLMYGISAGTKKWPLLKGGR